MRFLGLGLADAVPDANTIWTFREALKKADAVDALFARFDTRKAELIDLLANAEAAPPLLHPNMAEIFRRRISALHESLQAEDGKAEAAELFRTLIDQVTLVPEDGPLAIALRGDLAAILRFAAGKKNPALDEGGALAGLLSQESLVAGTGFEPVTFRL
jgi:site-specific DNA recombinase